MPQPLYPREGDPVPIVQEAGWAPGPSWMGMENLAPPPLPNEIWSLDQPAQSESPYKTMLSWPTILCCATHKDKSCHLSINLPISLYSIYKDRYLGFQDRNFISATKIFFTPAFVSTTKFQI